MRINYPNESDKVLSDQDYPGSDIYIHGDCVTIGCIPITDDKIKELYVISVLAKSNGQDKIPVHIFPYRFKDKTIREMIQSDQSYSVFLPFWDNINPGHEYFEEYHKLPKISVNDSTGAYVIYEN